MTATALALALAVAGMDFSAHDLRQWGEAVQWLADARCPDDCWTILDYDLVEWPQGRVALDACMLRWPRHFDAPDHPLCGTYLDIADDPERQEAWAEELSMTMPQFVRWLTDVLERYRCGWSRREKLAYRVEVATAERSAQWECTWAVMETNERRRGRGGPELDDYELCWTPGADFWREFYDGPTGRTP